MKFTENLEKIEKILKKIDSHETTLEEALGDFEKGVGMIKDCKEFLENARQKVKELTEDISDEDSTEEEEDE